mmetsp:Transcript_21269/g.38813  ORF Transcript_21269/g.38813 Transcript_21269/m.38813 type:complete len:289 (+) Transcript_21269:82-948(+)
MRFYFIRHAESQNNKREVDDVSSTAKAYADREPDPSITDRGVSQAQHCALALRPLSQESTPREHRVRWVYSSLMRRALQTAKPIAEALGVPLIGKAALHEEGGIFCGERNQPSEADAPQQQLDVRHGMTKAEVLELTPGIELGQDVDEHGWWRGGREREEDMLKRAADVAAWLHELAASSDGGSSAGATVVVSHGLFLSHLFVELLGCSHHGERSPAFLSMNCSLSILDIAGGRVGVCMLNSVEHMPAGELRTGHKALGFQLVLSPPFDGSCRAPEEENGHEVKRLKR